MLSRCSNLYLNRASERLVLPVYRKGSSRMNPNLQFGKYSAVTMEEFVHVHIYAIDQERQYQL